MMKSSSTGTLWAAAIGWTVTLAMGFGLECHGNGVASGKGGGPVGLDAAPAAIQGQETGFTEDTRRAELLLAAEQYTVSARKARERTHFQEAGRMLAKAEALLLTASRTAPEVRKRLEAVKAGQRNVSQIWADALIRQARALARKGKLDVAISLCREARKLDPRRLTEADRRIARYEKAKRVAHFRQLTSPEHLGL
ncbi:MAG: tetratricopeptide repeat protein [Lentisphaerae bacterium]|jgi:hypothetical protein|nr:tetratricopeptide repeat protein [Lentisphaerota bacterium]MBT5613180.1 tetratricopeptide repeat protein [Lentisphaerota bacterium]MBT7061849.1 tetratricopeptide repeat protein [Lentisphaerota bacterium]MBT7843675.1 tetratricopeptide repeat protein [Lentisphaerota bacterium]